MKPFQFVPKNNFYICYVKVTLSEGIGSDISRMSSCIAVRCEIVIKAINDKFLECIDTNYHLKNFVVKHTN